MKQTIQPAADGTRLLYPIAHDLKAPLNRILGLVQLINFSKDNLNDEQREYLDKIYQVTSDGLDMVNSMVDAYDLESDDFREHIKTVDVGKIITTRIQSYCDVAQLKNIEILFEKNSAKPIKVPTDKLLFGRIVDNLLSNAIKFSPMGKKIRVGVEDKEKSVTFYVLDEGPGISKQESKMLYKKFQRLSIRPTAGETTTSLGLYVVKSIIEKLNGSIECKSEPRKGSKFTVTLCK